MTSGRRLVPIVGLALVVAACTSSGSTAPGPTSSPRPSPIVLHGRMAFSWDRNGNVDIWVMDLPEGTLHRLTTTPGLDISPSWSPDGSRIAFRSERTGDDEVWVMDADGSHQRDLSRNPASDYSPAWSPNGDTIVFASSRADRTGNDLWLMDADGSRQRLLVHQTGIDEYPTWSPDGSRVAFNCSLGVILPSQVGDFEVCVVDADGSNLHRVTDAPGISAAGGWSPDGQWILFDSNRNTSPNDVSPCGQLFVVRPDGTGLRALTDGSTRDCGGRWSSDGHILFSSDRRSPGGDADVWVIDAEGSDPTLVTPFPGEKEDATFLPSP